MYKLEKRDYAKAVKPLHEVGINRLFAESVVRGESEGEIYADDPARPEVFYVVHPYGMSLLFGSTEKENFNRALRAYLLDEDRVRTADEWLQVYPDAWNGQIRGMLGEKLIHVGEAEPAGTAPAGPCVEIHERVNFAFDRDRYLVAKAAVVPEEHRLVKTNGALFDQIEGSVVPKHFWRNAAAFEQAGLGYSLLRGAAHVATAFSAYRNERQLEIGIETAEASRGKGYAYLVSQALIDECLRLGLEPVWACRRGNEGSYRLAQKLGFVPTLTLPYYRLTARV
ncbi:GNAT family N-acetyltransferase [Paenibacillus timonensis]|uniref:GNAT family N-acetyltransferase n=1 Tax=Paenibacillus timonensis TaxID=225915 RepID=A0ABW3SA14_9BACL|nr:GNAT family N-acetyltransferase [Paenibacillus timonensis]MCH1639812.1 GNAT family N-acetyltransferase [Paenibacillus timonensis]